jgi:DNA-binding transcriptional regulator PaaX
MINRQDLQTEFEEFIDDLSGAVRDLILRPYSFSISKMNYPRTTYNYKLRKFERQGLITKLAPKKYNNSFAITKQGKLLLARPKFTQKRTDGLSSIVMFDIPEEYHRERNILRRYLLRQGYTLIQKSVLIAPFKISNEFKELIVELKLKPFIKILSARIEY